MIDETELRQLSREERRQLAHLLATIDAPHVLRDRRYSWRRRLALLIVLGGCVVLAVWIGVLAVTLPKHFHATHWRGAWVGFDVALLAAFAATAWAAWRQRQVLILTLTVTGTLLLCDAWFDLVLDIGTSEFWMSVFTAAVAEVPLALLMFNAARRLHRMSVGLVLALEGIDAPVPALWRVPLFAEGLETVLPARYRSDPVEQEPQAPATVE